MLGPGLKPSDERTLEYLKEVAVDVAKGMASGSVKRKPRNKNFMDKVGHGYFYKKPDFLTDVY